MLILQSYLLLWYHTYILQYMNEYNGCHDSPISQWPWNIFFFKGKEGSYYDTWQRTKRSKKIKLSAKETEEIPRIKLCVYLTSHNNIQIKVNK